MQKFAARASVPLTAPRVRVYTKRVIIAVISLPVIPAA